MSRYFRNPQGSKPYTLSGKNTPRTIVFAEGQSEAYFLEKWLTNLAYNDADIAVICCRGRKNLGPVLKNHSIEENFASVINVGFFLDAESKPAANSVPTIDSLLKEIGFISRKEKLNLGYQQIGGRKVSIFISPNNADPGFIEHTVLNEISTSEQFICLAALNICTTKLTGESIHPKSMVQSYLGLKQPGLAGTHHGFSIGHLDVMNPAYDSIRGTFTPLL